MIALDTNILARFYVDDPNDSQAAKQRPIAQRIMVESTYLFVPLTIVLELEWVLRAFYGFNVDNFTRFIEHLLGLGHVTVEDWPRVSDALALHRAGLDFADALHLRSSEHCATLLSFDKRRFAHRAARLGAKPPVQVPDP